MIVFSPSFSLHFDNHQSAGKRGFYSFSFGVFRPFSAEREKETDNGRMTNPLRASTISPSFLLPMR